MDLHLFMTIYHFAGRLLLLLLLMLVNDISCWLAAIYVECCVQQVANLSLANITFTHNTNPLEHFHLCADCELNSLCLHLSHEVHIAHTTPLNVHHFHTDLYEMLGYVLCSSVTATR